MIYRTTTRVNISLYPLWAGFLVSLIITIGKLFGEVSLSWVWVFSPMWITLSLTLFLLLSFVFNWISFKQE